MHERRLDLPLTLALFGSLVIHALGLSAANRIAEGHQNVITAMSATPPTEEDDEHIEPDGPDEFKINPGIDNGAMSTVTWIGYEEYEEHLAQLAEADQAAFTRAETRGIPLAHEDAERPTETTEALAQSAKENLADAEAVETADDTPAVAEVTPEEIEEEVALDTLVHAELSDAGTPTEVRPEPTEKREVVTEVVATTAPRSDVPPKKTSAEPVATEGEPTAPDAEKTDKDSAATSTKEIPEIDWDHGRPIAIEGVEIHPYSLYRHIVVDSGDIRFAMSWTNRVARNPIVELSFDRTGRVARLEMLRVSGHETLDSQYLRSWLARWTASGEKLRELKPSQVTKPIMIRLVFIEEPKKKEKKGGG